MNEFLKSREQIDRATKMMQDYGWATSGISCKNWEISKVIPMMANGDWLDLGSDGSVVLPNLVKMGVKGKKYGVDLAYPENVASPTDYTLVKGDLMKTPFENGSFDYITSLSTIEHAVDFELFAKEVSRLLRSGGWLIVSFDYWNPKLPTEKTKLYNLDWNILDESDVFRLIGVLDVNGLQLSSEIDWTVKDAVINPRYCSPADVSYTFGILSFNKK